MLMRSIGWAGGCQIQEWDWGQGRGLVPASEDRVGLWQEPRALNSEPREGLGNRYMVGSHGRGQVWSPLEDSRAWYQGIAKWGTRLSENRVMTGGRAASLEPRAGLGNRYMARSQGQGQG